MKRREFILSPALTATAAVAQGAPARPHLYFDTAVALRMRARIAKESAFQERWGKLLERAKTSDWKAGSLLRAMPKRAVVSTPTTDARRDRSQTWG